MNPLFTLSFLLFAFVQFSNAEESSTNKPPPNEERSSSQNGADQGEPQQKAEISADAKELFDEVAKAYDNLKSLQLGGKVSVNIDVAGEQQKTNQPFTSSFEAPNKFKHQMADAITLGSDGKQVYAFSKEANSYVALDAPAGQVPMDELPSFVPQLLQTQNPSLLFAIAEQPLEEVARTFGKVTKLSDEKISGQSYPTLAFISEEENNRLLLRIDPKTHLVRQVIFDFKRALEKQGATNVNVANVVVDYSTIQPEAEFAPTYFAWVPPKDAVNMRESAGAGKDADKDLVGKPAPDFTLASMDGKKVSLSEFKGEVVVLDFWATWCGPCVKSLPIVDKVYQDKKDEKVNVFAVNLQEPKEKIQKFVESKGIKLPVLLDESGKTALLYNVEAIPKTVIIGKDGRVTKVLTGASPNLEEELRTAIEAAGAAESK